MHHVARREVLPGFFIVLFIEAADELFEDRAHAVVVQARQAHGAVAIQARAGD